MQSILREKLLFHGMKLSAVSKIYQTESYNFIGAYFSWLEDAEKDLSGLRSPISILLQSEKSSLTSVLDGYVPSFIRAETSTRKIHKAVAAQSLERVSREVFSKIETIDRLFEELSEKLCHAIAVLGSKYPELYKEIHASQSGVTKVIRLLGNTPETLPMHNYFAAKLSSIDLNYLLSDIISKIVSNKKRQKKPSPSQSV